MRKDILVLGKGFMGERVRQAFDCDISSVRINSLEAIERDIRERGPKVIINCIGHIGNQVDDCELDKDKTLFANTFVPIVLAEVALRNNIKLVHISSGCIYEYDYEKDAPIEETKTPDFFSLYYSRTKIYAERSLDILSSKFNILITRIRIPLDTQPHHRNILTKIVAYKRVIDLPNSVTYIPDFIEALRHLIKIDARGIYNVACKGGLRYRDLLDVYRKYVPEFEYEIIDYKKLNLVRTNLILSTKRLEETGFKVRNIREVLEECVKEYIKH